MKISILIFLLLFSYTFSKAQYSLDCSASPHVSYVVDTLNGKILISYTFKDQVEKLRTFKLEYNKTHALNDIDRYGVPAFFYENVLSDKPIPKEKIKAIKHGFYKFKDKLLIPDRSAIVSFYRPYCKAIAGGIIYTLLSEGIDSRTNRIEMAMRFVQDLPLGSPQISDSAWVVHGIVTPPELLFRMCGNRESKSILFVSILSYLVNKNEIFFINQGVGKTLIAIKGTPNLQQTYIDLNQSTYIIADITGPSRLKWGEDSGAFSSVLGYKVEPLRIRGYWFHGDGL